MDYHDDRQFSYVSVRVQVACGRAIPSFYEASFLH